MPTIEEICAQEGLQQGIQKAIQLGIEQGIELGIQEGIQLGIRQGIQQTLRQNTELMAEHVINALCHRFDVNDRKKLWGIRALTFDKLCDLVVAMFDFHSAEDVSAWVQEHYIMKLIEADAAWLKEYQDLIREAGGDFDFAASGKFKL